MVFLHLFAVIGSSMIICISTPVVHDCQDGYEIDADGGGVRQQLFTDHAGSDSAETVGENQDNVKDLAVDGYNNFNKSVAAEVGEVAKSTHDGIVTPEVDPSATPCLAIAPYVPKSTSEAYGIAVKESKATSEVPLKESIPSPSLVPKPPASAILGAKPKAIPQPQVQGSGGRAKRKLESEGNHNKKNTKKDVKEKGGQRKKINKQPQHSKKSKNAAAPKKSKVQPKAKAQVKKKCAQVCKDANCQEDAFCNLAAICCNPAKSISINCDGSNHL